MKSLTEMTDKQFEAYLKTIKPTLPVWSGNKILAEIKDMFVDRNGNQALIKYVYWVDKKGTKHKSTAWVKWG